MSEARDTSDRPQFSDVDKSRARQWFRKAADCRERREYDYAIECYITALTSWPEAVEEGHMPLYSLAIQRQQAGGKKPGMMEGMKKPISGKDPRQAMLNAELLMAKDPQSSTYLDAVLRNAAKAGLVETAKWIAPKVMDSLRRDAKPNAARFKAFRASLVELAEQCDRWGDAPASTVLYDQAVTSVEYQLARNPGDAALRDEQRDLSGKLAIAKGKYAEADSFRDSLKDADQQKLLHDAERVQQGEQTIEAVLDAARKAWEAEPNNASRLNALLDLLTKREDKRDEDEAIAILLRQHESTRNYSFKARADDIRLRQLKRDVRALKEAARGGDEEQRQQARLAEADQVQSEVAIYRERVERYPTDLGLKYRLGEAFFRAGEYDNAIPMLQAGQGDPRSRFRAMLLVGRGFFEKKNYAQAAAVLDEGLRQYEGGNEDVQKELLYWLARAHEAAGEGTAAKDAYGKLLRMDYNYRNGDARKRLDALVAA